MSPFLLLLELLHHQPRNDNSLDLRCALIDLINLSIPHQLLNGIIRIVTVSTKHLYSIGGDFVGPVSSKTFGNGCVVTVAPTCKRGLVDID